jgi:ABC-type multidrug transport system permease subunit
MFGTAQPALLSFPEERPVFLREYSTNHYGVLPYFMSRLTVEVVVTAVQVLVQVIITFFMVGFTSNFGLFYLIVYALAMTSTALAVALGCAVEDPKLGQELLPLLFVPQMLFSGFFVVPELIPVWLRWAQYLCSLTYAVRLSAVEEFYGRAGCETCSEFLEVLSADPDETWWYWIVLASLFVVFRLLALAVLRRKAEKFF